MKPPETLRSALPLLMFAIFALSVAWACFGERGILANETLGAEIEAREERIAERNAVIEHLREEIRRLQEDPRVQERWVREELGFVRPGEVVYVFPGDRSADFELLRDRDMPAPAEGTATEDGGADG